MKIIGLTLCVALLVLHIQCSEDDVRVESPDGKNLIGATSMGKQSALTLKALLAFSGYAIDPSIFSYDAEIYRVQYRTTYQGNEIEASGLIILPSTDEAVGMLSYQRGTIVKLSDAPSEQSINGVDVLLYSAMASPGFIAVVPDMIGFGSSSAIVHPYYIEQPTAAAITDMLYAARELATDKGMDFNGKVFLAGYSQGGYATMAAHKAIEKDGLDDMTLVASFPAAGGFDLKEVQQYIFSLTEYKNPYYLAYLANSYKLYYAKNSLLGDFFNAPYASKIPGLFNGVNSAAAIDGQLTTSIPQLLTSGVLSGINTQSRYAYIADLLNQNSLVNGWHPKNLMYIYHGKVDDTVPYSNSEGTYQKLIANGATADKLELIPLQGDHSSAVKPFIEGFVSKIMQLK
jgi:pimeloyl-ACP methyl ester carboxylesterase